MKPRRVLIVTESFLPSTNGVTNSVVQVLHTFKQEGIDAMVVAPTGPVDSPNEYLGFPVVRSNYIPFAEFPVAIPGFFLRSVIEDFSPDVIHIASPFMLGFQTLVLANQLGIPSVAIFQTDLAGYAQRYGLKILKSFGDALIGRIHSLATLNLAPTTETADYLNQLGVKNVALWGRGVDLERFHPNRKFDATRNLFRSEFAADTDIVVGFVGRLNPEKQVHLLSQLFEKDEKLRFLIVGDGPERATLERAFAGHPVHFTGKLTGDRLGDAYAAIDIFVHFGIEETFGQTIQEAQAAGIPVVAPNSGGPKFLVNHEIDGYLVEPGSTTAYVEPVLQLMHDVSLRLRMSEAARRRVLEKSWRTNNLALIEHYSRAISAAKVRPDELV